MRPSCIYCILCIWIFYAFSIFVIYSMFIEEFVKQIDALWMNKDNAMSVMKKSDSAMKQIQQLSFLFAKFAVTKIDAVWADKLISWSRRSADNVKLLQRKRNISDRDVICMSFARLKQSQISCTRKDCSSRKLDLIIYTKLFQFPWWCSWWCDRIRIPISAQRNLDTTCTVWTRV